MQKYQSRSLTFGVKTVLFFSLFVFSACDALPPEVNHYWTWLQKLGNVLWAQMNEPEAKKSPDPKSAQTDTPKPQSDEEFISNAAKNAKANAEILHEIFQVVFIREPKDRADFGNWVDTLNQGASLEGVYNGLIHSADYRKMEVASPGASVEALRIFGEELALLEKELPQPSANLSPILASNYSKQFIGSSVFTLKRLIGEEALKVVEVKSEYREKLALWYSKWVTHMIQRNVDFGVSLRNKVDEPFHYKFVLDSSEDRVKWEILNRLHRVLNEADKQKQ